MKAVCYVWNARHSQEFWDEGFLWSRPLIFVKKQAILYTYSLLLNKYLQENITFFFVKLFLLVGYSDVLESREKSLALSSDH